MKNTGSLYVNKQFLQACLICPAWHWAAPVLKHLKVLPHSSFSQFSAVLMLTSLQLVSVWKQTERPGLICTYSNLDWLLTVLTMQILVVGEAVFHIATSRTNKPLCNVLYVISLLKLEQPCSITGISAVTSYSRLAVFPGLCFLHYWMSSRDKLDTHKRGEEHSQQT